MSDEITRFVRSALAEGLGRGEIAEALEKGGWPKDQIRTALEAYAEVEFPIPVPQAKSYLSARETFLYLVLFSTLYTSAVAFIHLAFAVIEQLLPEREALGSYAFAGRVNWAVAALVVAFPIFLILAKQTNRAIDADPAKRTSKVRKWLTYLTLFIASAALVVDLMTLVYYFLDGDISFRFLLKVVTVAAVAALVLGHYLGELKRADETSTAVSSNRRLVAGLSTALVGFLVLLTLWLSASPWYARKIRRDEQRKADLRAIAEEVRERWEDYGEVPEDLEAFSTQQGVSLRRIRDPRTDQLYDFRHIESGVIELCAEFETSENHSRIRFGRFGTPPRERFWDHQKGRNCFRITAPAAPPETP